MTMAKISRSVLVLVAFVMFSASGCESEKGLKIKSISPKSGPADGQGYVRIHGNGFRDQGNTGITIYFGDRKARFQRFEGDDTMVVVAPPGDEGTTVDVHVIFGDGREHKFQEAYSYKDPKAGFDVNALAPGEK